MAEVLVRFYSGKHNSQRAKSRVFCPVSAWNEQEGMPALPRRANAQVAVISDVRAKLERLREYVFSCWMKEQYDAREGWLQQTIDDCFSISKRNAPKTLADVYDEYAEARNLDDATRKQYRVLLDALNRWAEKRTLYVDEIKVGDIDAFCSFFRHEKTKDKTIERSQNTITGKLKRWRALMNFAVLRGYIEASPFKQYKVPAEVFGTPIFLTTEERDRLYAFDGLAPALAVQRDIFIFQCHIGCRVSDLISLTKDNVTPDGFLQYIPKKQRKRVPTTVRVPLSPVAKEIIERYADSDIKKLLPFVSEQKFNKYIHAIMKEAGMDRVVIVPNKLTMQPEHHPLYEVVTSHVARKTFIEAMFRETKSERITSAFTGHAEGSKAFSRYTEVDDDMKKEILSRLQN
ncbi:MAG: phage integrase SAM-like domain-containing protein [Paludibacteraceae bacterium]|nr:phage integrase SAM-like domain-containing protein [Paludibacteraceae bacterium]